MPRIPSPVRPLFALLLVASCQPAPAADVAAQAASLTAPPAVGTFTPLPPSPFAGGANSLLLLSDGSVLINSDGDWLQWARLVPDAHGSYVNGTWSTAASGLHGRLYYPEFLLPDGRVFLGGGEYIQNNDADSNQTELFDPTTNTWTAGPPGLLGDIGDVSAAMLPNGRILMGYRFGSQTQIYDPTTNAFTMGASMLSGDSGSEGAWQLLEDGLVFASIRTVQRYLPATDQWVADTAAPIVMSSDFEQGPVTLLQDGRVFACSDRQFAAYFTPGTSGGSGSWTTAASLPGDTFGDDVPAALLPNGKVLIESTVGQFGNLSLFELDPTANSYTSVTSPLPPTVGYTTRMLMLPNGQVLFSGPPGGNPTGFYVYTATGAPQDAWRPVVNSVTPNSDGSFTVSGTQLNGRSYGAVYGDDSMSSSNYPIVYLTDGTGHLSYARSYQFSTMGVRTGSAVVSARFRLPAGLANGNYNLFVSGAGISSASAFPFTVGGGGNNTTTLGPVADTFVRSGSFAGQNFGTTTTMEVKIPTNPVTSPDNTRRAFLRFDLTTVSGTVSAAKLHLFGSHPTNTAGVSVFAVTDNGWGETTATFNLQPALGAQQGGSVTIGTTAADSVWDVGAFVASQKAAGASAVSLAVTMDAGNDAGPAVFNTRENAAHQPQLVVTSSGSSGGNVAPTIATAASAAPNPVTGTSTALSVLGADDGGEPALVYTWSATGPAAVTFSANGTNAAKASTATFTRAGSYTFQAVVKDTGGLTATSSLVVTVNQTLTAIAVAPATASVATGGTQQFAASPADQFGAPISPGPMITWAVSGGGSISAGLFTAGATAGGPFTVTASGGGKSGTASVTVTASTSTKTLSPTADAYVRDGASASTNFGTDPTLVTKNSSAAGNNRRSFLKFDSTSVTGKVTSAKLRLFGNHATGTTQDSAYAITVNTWTETGITWTNQPALGAKQSSVTVTTTAKYYELDVTPFVSTQKTANINTVSLAVLMDTVTNNAPDTFNSRQATTNKPQLVVTTGP